MSDRQSNNTNELALLGEWISKTCASGPVPVLTGMNGDMDTIGSAIALAASNPNMVACGLHQGRVAKKVCERYSAPFRKILQFSDLPKNISGVIIVDAASPSQIGIDIPNNIPKCIIFRVFFDFLRFGDHLATTETAISVEQPLPVCRRDDERASEQSEL
ncbi:MAG: hypothetical protein VXY53_02760, partial [Candidatus Thermoplasmatota archaeon]|nr:hypothetical protein [Candidatus Thermoplasmatota archaeon]